MPKEGHDFKELGVEFEKIRSELQIVKGFSGKLFMCVCVCVLKKKKLQFYSDASSTTVACQTNVFVVVSFELIHILLLFKTEMGIRASTIL